MRSMVHYYGSFDDLAWVAESWREACQMYWVAQPANRPWAMTKKSPGLDTGALTLLRRRCLSAVGDSLLDPGFYFLGHPRNPASSEPYPLGELAGYFEPRDVRKAVGHSVNRFEFLLGNELPYHRKSLVKGSLQAPVSPGQGRA